MRPALLQVLLLAGVAMLLVSVAALLGLFGRGPLSTARLGASGAPLHSEYERFLRLKAPSRLVAYLGAAAVRPDSTAELWLDRRWLDDMQIKSITPEPRETRAVGDRVTYPFRVDPAATALRVTVELETRSLGVIRGRIGLPNGQPFSFSQFAYP